MNYLLRKRYKVVDQYRLSAKKINLNALGLSIILILVLGLTADQYGRV